MKEAGATTGENEALCVCAGQKKWGGGEPCIDRQGLCRAVGGDNWGGMGETAALCVGDGAIPYAEELEGRPGGLHRFIGCRAEGRE